MSDDGVVRRLADVELAVVAHRKDCIAMLDSVADVDELIEMLIAVNDVLWHRVLGASDG